MIALLKRHFLITFFVLAYGISWLALLALFLGQLVERVSIPNSATASRSWETRPATTPE
jgi:hypothetical protein